MAGAAKAAPNVKFSKRLNIETAKVKKVNGFALTCGQKLNITDNNP